jgi:hypothetical protein
MRLIKFSVLGLLVAVITIDQAFADILVYQCQMKNGQFLFSDQPCKHDEKEKSRKIIKNLLINQSVAPKPIKDDPTPIRKESSYTQTKYPFVDRRVMRQHRSWDFDYPQQILVIPYPYPYPSYNQPNTYSAQPPLFNPPLSFKPPLTVQP